MFDELLQRLESRFQELVEVNKRLNAENSALTIERDNLLRERQFMRDELDRILQGFARIGEDSP